MTTLTITGQQVKFINDLMEQRVDAKAYVTSTLAALSTEGVENLDRASASKMIGTLLTYPKVKKVAVASILWQPGIYMGADKNVYKVQESKYNPGKFYAKRLIVSKKGSARFEYDPSGMKQITSESKVSLQQALDLGIQYGVCVRCGRTLTDPNSVKKSIGPVCIKYFQ